MSVAIDRDHVASDLRLKVVILAADGTTRRVR